MMGVNRVKAGVSASAVVAVIASRAALAAATRLRRPPDLFELRLDILRHSLNAVEGAIQKLRAPLILTARHPAEGGHGNLGAKARQALVERFLGHASFIDLELGSLKPMRTLIRKARRQGVALILSWHNLDGPLSGPVLRRKAKTAPAEGAAIFKVATRTESSAELARLISLFQETPMRLPIAAMGIGRFGRASRLQLAGLGSALTYVSLGQPNVPGQPSLSQLRRHSNAYKYIE